jgi:pimeloyl-ACP methyl ester carboxylesterase
MRQPAQRLPHVTPALLARVRAVIRILQVLSPRLAARVAFWMFLKPQRRELAQSDAAFMATARLHMIPSAADQVQVYEWGSGSRTVLIAHGWGSRASRFAPLAAALVERGWRVLALDAPGHGLSPGRSSSLPQFMAALDAVATTLGPVQALIGHSLGALAIVCARSGRAPDWFSSLRKVVLISMPSGAPFLVEAFHGMCGIKPATAHRLQDLFKRRFGCNPEFFIAAPAAAMALLPTLVVHDRGDDIVPFSHGEELLPAIGNARLLTTEGLGHSALTRDSATMLAIGEFLDEDVS